MTGEVITDADVRLGYNHRGMEKLAEEKTWHPEHLPDRAHLRHLLPLPLDLLCPGVEKLMEIEPPKRGIYLRSLVAELERIHSHLLWLGVAGHEIGFDTFFMYTWRDREVVMDILAMLSGNRVNYAMNTLGGVRRDIDEAQKKRILDSLGLLRKRSDLI